MSERPKFLPSFIDLLKRESEQSGLRAVIPFKLIVCVLVGGCSAYMVPSEFWSNERWDISTAVYGGLLTFSGLILALGWSAFSRIYETLFRGDFGAYLYDKGLLSDYLVHISFMHFTQVASVALCATGLMFVLFDLGWPLIDRLILAAAVAALVYGLKQALDAVTVMNDLAWHSATFERHKSKISSGNNVTPFAAGK